VILQRGLVGKPKAERLRLEDLEVDEMTVLGGADKSLARPGRQQATATKLGIYSTYFPTKLNTLLRPLL
jgi:hypothetical protein